MDSLRALTEAKKRGELYQDGWISRLEKDGFVPMRDNERCKLGKMVMNESFIIHFAPGFGSHAQVSVIPRGVSQKEQVNLRAVINTEEVSQEDLDLFFRALSRPDLLPTCVGIDGASNLIEWCLKKL